MNIKEITKKTWYFIWHDDSLASWIVNIVLAFVIVKFLIYPGLGLVLDTDFPIVAVISSSMEHKGNFNEWWENSKGFYEKQGITKEQFKDFTLNNGFNKGDIMILYSKDYLELGDIIVFQGSEVEPIIHRIIKIHDDNTYQTKGDNYQTNPESRPDEKSIPKGKIYGKAVIRVPFLGWLKIVAVDTLNFFKSQVF